MFPQTCFPLSSRSSTGDEQLMHGLCKLPEDENTSSVQFSCSVILDSLRLHGLQYARLPCPSPTPRASIQFSHSVVSNSMQPHGLQQASLPVHHQLPEFTQIHVHQVGDTIQPSYPVIPFSSCLQSFPGSFPMSQFFASGGRRIGVSASALVFPMKIQD